MPSENNIPKFLYGSQANYDSITNKDSDTIYFTSDTRRIFIGEVEYTRLLTLLDKSYLDLPDPTSYSLGTLFFSIPDLTLYSNCEYEGNIIWKPISVYYLHDSVTAKTVGENESSTLDFGGTFKIPKIVTDEYGHISSAEDITITLPSASSTNDFEWEIL